MSHVAAAVATVAAREPWLAVRGGEPDGLDWHRAEDLLGAPALDRLVGDAAARIAAEHPSAPPAVVRTVAAAVLLDHWGWALAVAGAGALAATGQVLDLQPDRVHLQLQDGQVTGIAVHALSGRAGESGLRAELTAHLRRLHGQLTGGDRPLLRRSSRLLHGGIGDAVATALATQAEGLAVVERDRVLDLAGRLLADAGWGEPGWLVVAGAGGQQHRTRRRTSCCLWYRLPDQQPCLSCPRLTDAERADRLRARADGAA